MPSVERNAVLVRRLCQVEIACLGGMVVWASKLAHAFGDVFYLPGLQRNPLCHRGPPLGSALHICSATLAVISRYPPVVPLMLHLAIPCC